MPTLPIFTFTSLIYCYLIWNESVFLTVLNSNPALFVGYSLVGLSILLIYLPTLHYRHKYDVFSVGVLVIWFADWRQIFGPQAPIFYAYTVYFALFSVIMTHFVINQSSRLDDSQIKLMNIILNWKPFNPFLLAFATFGSLSLPKHYLLYPLSMTFLLIQYALAACMDEIENKV